MKTVGYARKRTYVSIAQIGILYKMPIDAPLIDLISMQSEHIHIDPSVCCVTPMSVSTADESLRLWRAPLARSSLVTNTHTCTPLKTNGPAG